ncbi:MAG TPA: hypothetical protein VGD74_09690 [Vulgatibacter sp.]
MNDDDKAVTSDASPSDVDLFGWKTIAHWVGFVLRAPGRHKSLALGAFIAVFGLSCAAILVVPPRYQVQATLLAGYPEASALAPISTGRVLEATHAARDLLLRRENLREILERTDFVDQYLEKRPWAVRAKDWLFALVRGEPRKREDLEAGLLDTFEQRIWIEVRSEGTLAITFQWWDAGLAKQIVSATQESFLRARRSSEIDAIGEAVQVLEAQRIELEHDIDVANDAFEDKQSRLGIGALRRPRVDHGAPAPDPELAKLQVELAAKNRSLAEMEGTRLQRISELQAELLQQETIYADEHPIIKSTRRALKSLSEPGPRIAELKSGIEKLAQEIAERGAGSSTPLAAVGPYLQARIRLDQEDPRLDFERGELENLLKQHAELRNRIQSVKAEKELAEAAFGHRYRVVSPAQLPRGPIKPYPLIFSLGGLLGGLAFAFFMSAAADLRHRRVIEGWQVEEKFALPVLTDVRKRRRAE